MSRFVWLVVVPGVSAIAPWFIYGAADLDPVTGSLSDRIILLTALVPMMGVASIVGYGLLGNDTRRMWSMFPFAAWTVCYFAAHITVTQIIEDEDGTLESTNYWVGLLWAFDSFSFFLLPVSVVVGAILLFQTARPRA